MNDTAEFDNLEEAVGSYVRAAGGVEPANVWVTPGAKFTVRLPRCRVPRLIVAGLVRQPDGKLMMAPMNWPFLLRLKQLPRRLGLPFDDRVLRRLALSGFIKAVNLTPAIMLIDVESLYEHMQASSGEEGEFFWTPDRTARYHEAVSLTRNGSAKKITAATE